MTDHRRERLPFELPLGVRTRPGGGAEVRLWAPRAERIVVVATDPEHQTEPALMLEAEPAGLGTWTCRSEELAHGRHYWVVIDEQRWPDPWSRWQPDGTTGPSVVVDPAMIGATTPGEGARPPRPALELADAAIYELHVGTFSEAGTFAGAIEHIAHLVELGITHVELMPVNEFPGRRNWGYDGIFWSAASSAYGGPAGLVQLVDALHDAGLGVILDVVFNHLGPTGSPIYDAFGPFFTDRHHTPWGDAINVDGPGSGAIRETILQAAEWWVGAVGVDGLRVDACHAIVDQSARHVLAELTERVRAVHPGALLISESGLNDPRVVRPEETGGWGFDADWSDDFHHALRTLLTDDRQGWYADFGQVADLAKAFHRPLVHDGTWSDYRGRRFGAPADGVAPEHFVVFDQNHDQVGNRPLGDRLPADVRRVAAFLTILSSFTPMLFMGEEYGETRPFPFFSDHQDPFIADATRNGRREEFADFTAASGQEIPDPQDPNTFESARLSWAVDDDLLALYRTLLAARRSIPREEPVVTHDEDARWIRVERGRSAVVANLATEPQSVPSPPGVVDLASWAGAEVGSSTGSDGLHLPPLAAVLLTLHPATEEPA